MALVVWALARSGFGLRPRLDPRGIGIHRIGRLGGWVLVSVGAAQVLLVVATRAASISGPGGISVYQNAFAVFQMPIMEVASRPWAGGQQVAGDRHREPWIAGRRGHHATVGIVQQAEDLGQRQGHVGRFAPAGRRDAVVGELGGGGRG
jgi:hypothetical protein